MEKNELISSENYSDHMGMDNVWEKHLDIIEWFWLLESQALLFKDLALGKFLKISKLPLYNESHNT